MVETAKEKRARQENTFYGPQKMSALEQLKDGIIKQFGVLKPAITGESNYELREFYSDFDADLMHWGIMRNTPGLEIEENRVITAHLLREMEKFPRMGAQEKVAFFNILNEFEGTDTTSGIANKLKSIAKIIQKKPSVDFPRTLTDVQIYDAIDENTKAIEGLSHATETLEDFEKTPLGPTLNLAKRVPLVAVSKEIAKPMGYTELNSLNQRNRRLYEELNRRSSLDFGEDEQRVR